MSTTRSLEFSCQNCEYLQKCRECIASTSYKTNFWICCLHLLAKFDLNYHVNIMTMTRYGSPGRAQSSLKNIFNRITAFHMSLVQVSRQNTEETETEMFWKEEAALFNAFNAMLSIFMIFWVNFLSNVKNLKFNKSLRLFELMVEWIYSIDKRWTSIEFESQTFPPRRPLHQGLSEFAGYNLGSASKFFWKLWLKNINRV